MVVVLVMLLNMGYAKDRYQSLVDEYRCMVCQGQSIADSSTPVAVSMRNQVKKMIDSGKTDEEIDQYFIERFGEGVKLSPIKSQKHGALWLFPGLLFLWLVRTVLIKLRNL